MAYVSLITTCANTLLGSEGEGAGHGIERALERHRRMWNYDRLAMEAIVMIVPSCFNICGQPASVMRHTAGDSGPAPRSLIDS